VLVVSVVDAEDAVTEDVIVALVGFVGSGGGEEVDVIARRWRILRGSGEGDESNNISSPLLDMMPAAPSIGVLKRSAWIGLTWDRRAAQERWLYLK
jgi:hypothetical protein